MSLLTVVQNAARQLSVPVPTTVISNTAETAVHLLRLAQEEGKALAARHPWQALISEHTFTTSAAETQSGGLPADFNGWVIPETMYNRTKRRYVFGPVAPEEWQSLKASLVSRVNPAYRIRGDALLFTPAPPASETVAFEYISKNWCKSSGGTRQDAWAADTDTGVLNEDLMTLGLVWRFKQAKGMEFQTDGALYERRVDQASMRDGTRPRISSAMLTRTIDPRNFNMPEEI